MLNELRINICLLLLNLILKLLPMNVYGYIVTAGIVDIVKKMTAEDVDNLHKQEEV